MPAALSEIISTADGRTIRSQTRISGPAREGGRCEPFKSAGSAQKFLSAHAAVNNTFKPQLIVLRAAAMSMWREVVAAHGGFRREVQPRRQHWFLNEKSGFPFRTPAFCSVSRGRRRLGEKEYRAPSVTPGVALRPRTQGMKIRTRGSVTMPLVVIGILPL